MTVIDNSNNGQPITERLKTETDPIRRHMLEEVRFHIQTESAGDFEAALQRLAPDAEYILYQSGQDPVTLRGVDVVRRDFYEQLVENIEVRHVWDITLLLVDDHAVITEGNLIAAMRGSALQKMGVEGADPDGFYLQKAHHMVVWPFDEEYRLIGETVFYGAMSTPEEMLSNPISLEDIRDYGGDVLMPEGLKAA